MKRGSCTVITAIAGGYDTLKSQPLLNAEQIAFVDEYIQQPTSPWILKDLPQPDLPPRLRAKIPKILTHTCLPDADTSLWIDGSVVIRPGLNLNDLANEYLGDADVAMFRHSQRNSIFEEGWECIRKGLDEKEVIYRQLCEYTKRGHPQNSGLHEATIILRKHSPKLERFNEAWWKEVATYSVRDQISFDVVAREHNVDINTFQGTVLRNKYFRKFHHLLPRTDAEIDNWRVHFENGLSEFQKGNGSAAVLELLRCIKIKNDEPDVWMTLAAVLVGQGALDDAIKSTARAAELMPDEPEPIQLLLRMFKKKGAAAEVLRCAEQLITLEPGQPDGYREAIEAALELGKVNHAARRQRELEVITPELRG